MRVVLTILLASLLFPALAGCEAPPFDGPMQLKKGVLDLEGIPDRFFPLDGKWESFPEKTPDGIDHSIGIYRSPVRDWNRIFPESRGAATFRLQFSRMEGDPVPALYTGVIGTAHAIYYREGGRGGDYSLLASAGTPSLEASEEIPSFEPLFVRFDMCESCDIALFISNHNIHRGGPRYPVLMGESGSLQNFLEWKERKDWALSGFLFAVTLLHLYLFLVRREYPNLWFSLTTFLLSIRAALQSHSLNSFYMASYSFFETELRLEYTTYFAAVPLFAAYFQSLYHKTIWQHFAPIIFIFAIPFIYLTWTENTLFFSSINNQFHLITGFGIIWIFYVLLRSILFEKDRRLESSSLLIGFLFIAVAVIHDILLDMFSQTISPYASYGWILFILSQSTLIGINNSKIWNNLRYLKANLHQEVKEKTAHLEKAVGDLTLKNNILQRELSLAHEIQTSFIPALPHRGKHFKADGFYIPRELVGGDYYDFITVDGGKDAILFADASGHGIPAAFVTAMARMHFMELIGTDRNALEMTEYINESMLKSLSTIEYLTGFIIILNQDYTMNYVNVSHPGGLLMRSGQDSLETLLPTGGVFIGALENAAQHYAQNTIQLAPGDRLLLFTDGIIEQRNIQNEEFGVERLESIFLMERHSDLNLISEHIKSAWLKHCEGVTGSDDSTLMILEIK